MEIRIVARGYIQYEGIDYDELFVPTVRFETVRTLLATAVRKNEPLQQWDVVTAYLHAPLNRPLYTAPPEGVDFPDGHVWQLRGGDGLAVNMSGQHVCVLRVRVPLLPPCRSDMAHRVARQGFDPGLQVFLCQQ
jgi:hypothetical protein